MSQSQTQPETSDPKQPTKKENITWESILKESSQQSKFDTKYVIILGKRGCGKRSLLDSLHGISQTKFPQLNDDRNPGKLRVQTNISAMDYTYLNVINLEDQDDETMTNVSFFVLDDIAHKDLLKSIIKIDNINNCLIVIMLNLEEPWNLLQDFNEWYNLLTEIVQQLNIPLTQYDQLKENLKTKIKKSRQLYKNTNDEKKSDNVQDQPNYEDIPLGEGVLNHNIGLPLILVCNKSDLIENSDILKEQKKLDFIQYHLRSTAIQYGASLIFTSTKSNLNLDIFYKYIIQQLYQLKTSLKSEFQITEQLFIPIGCDNLKLLGDYFSTIEMQNYDDFIKKPEEKINAQTNMLVIHEEQKFLEILKQKMQDQMQKIKQDISTESVSSITHSKISTTTTHLDKPDIFQKLPTSSHTLMKSESINVSQQSTQHNQDAVKNFYQTIMSNKISGQNAQRVVSKPAQKVDETNIQKKQGNDGSGEKKTQLSFNSEEQSKIKQLIQENMKKSIADIIKK